MLALGISGVYSLLILVKHYQELSDTVGCEMMVLRKGTHAPQVQQTP